MGKLQLTSSNFYLLSFLDLIWGIFVPHIIKYWIRVAGFPIDFEIAELEKKNDLG